MSSSHTHTLIHTLGETLGSEEREQEVGAGTKKVEKVESIF